MQLIYDSSAPKKATNLSINSDLLAQAKHLHINISAVLESALADKVKQKMRDEWLEENRDAIVQYNQAVSETGVFSDGMRSF